MKRVLIISHYYKHKNAMASVRPIKLAKYLDRQGYDVTVLAAMQRDHWCQQDVEAEVSETIHEYYAPESLMMNKLRKLYDKIHQRGVAKIQKSVDVQECKPTASDKPRVKKKIKKLLAWCYYFGIEQLENYILYKSFVREAKKQKLSHFDYVIATYPGAAAHSAGVWMKRRHRSEAFIADYRDPAYNPGARNNSIEMWFDKHRQDKTVKIADHVVCVSKGHAKTLKLQYGEQLQVSVVTNGYDIEDYQTEENLQFEGGKIHFVYTGTLYHGRRTVNALGRVLKQLVDYHLLSSDEIQFHYAGPDFVELVEQLKSYGLDHTAKNYGFVSRSISLAMQKAGDFVLLLNWNDVNYQGVIPGKIYEYMASGTPIIALIMGNMGNSESANMIRGNELGVVYEEAVAEDEQLLMEYMKCKIQELKQGTSIKTDISRVDLYEYSHIASEYAQVFSKIGKE